ncbi:hypothetical protein [Agromyces humi]|uniref:hypothetical protein n=1 Tax=Agromyces humi TaxID=1766800 RepID=UPI0013594FAE|nr:hypothetical protein [Agromyces humi]
MANPTEQEYTVIGVWVNDTPVSVGVVAGTHQVDGGNDLDDIDGSQGPWALTVTAADPFTAEDIAIVAMAEDIED